MSDTEEEFSDVGGEEGEEDAGSEDGRGEEAEEEEEQEQVEEEEKEPDDPPNPLIADMMAFQCLSQLSRIGPGLAHAYIKCDVSNRYLTDISLLKTYVHVRHLDVSQNYLRDVSAVSSMTHLLTLNANNNKLPLAALETMPYLQKASFDNNRLKTLEGVSGHPLLERLSLQFNEIERFYVADPTRLAHLRVLDLRGNKLTTTAGQYPPTLTELYLGGNLIDDLSGMEGLDNLKILHLRENQLVRLDSIATSKLPSLDYLNIRGNLIEDVAEVKHLQSFETIKALVVSDNPFQDTVEEYRAEVWAALGVRRSLQRIDKDLLDDEDELTEAEELLARQREEEAAARQAALEEEERAEQERREAEGGDQLAGEEDDSSTRPTTTDDA